MTGVEVDTSKLEAGIRQLAKDLDRATEPAATDSANKVAGRLRDLLPRRTGRLIATVQVTSESDGAAVHYGGSLPYASYIDGRTGATDDATANVDSAFHQAMTAVAEKAVRAL